MFDFLQLMGGIILSVGYIPQIYKLTKTKSTKDLDIKTFAAVLIGVALMEAYAINLCISGCGVMYLVTNTMSLTVQVVLVTLLCKYRLAEVKQQNGISAIKEMPGATAETSVRLKCPDCGHEFVSAPVIDSRGTHAVCEKCGMFFDTDFYEMFVFVTEPDAYGVYNGEEYEYRMTSTNAFSDEDFQSMIFQACEVERIYTGKIYFELTVLHNDECIECEEGELEIDMKLTDRLSQFVNWEKCSDELPPIYEIDRQNSRVTRIE